jgi:hypothetical protein
MSARRRSPEVARNSTQATNATAPPPTPLNSATICGTAVIFTLRAAGMPTAVPSTTPSRISAQLPIPGISSVAPIANAMPTAAIRLPRTAVLGPVKPSNP